MPCLKAPAPPAPPSITPLTFGASLPQFAFDPKLCCKILPFPIVTPPIPLPAAVFNPAVVATINANIAIMLSYFDAIAFDCPLE